MVVVLLCVAQFVVVLDVTIVAIALPAIQADLGVAITTLSWVVTAYTLTFGGFLLAAGRWADRAGRRRAFTTGMALFGLASLACGLASNVGVLLAARAVQGLGAALVAPAALALLLTARPDGPARARALGWWAATAASGGASGWVLGGVVSGWLDWRWVFLVNVPVCAAAALLAPRLLPEVRSPAPGSADVPGAVLATAGLAALVLALTWAGTRGLSAAMVAAGAVATGLLGAFVLVERRAADPLLGPWLLRRPGLMSAGGVALVLTAATTPPMLFCTLHAQGVLGLAPAVAGLLFPPFNLAVVAGSLAGPRVVAALGTRRAMAGGLLAIACGALALRAIGPDTPALPSMLGGFVLLGAGLGVASVASTTQGTAASDPGRHGVASGLLVTSAQVGNVLGIAALVPLATARSTTAGGGAAAQVAGYELGFGSAAALAAAAALCLAAADAPRRFRMRRRPPHRAPRPRPKAATGGRP
jgi:MFS family permease